MSTTTPSHRRDATTRRAADPTGDAPRGHRTQAQSGRSARTLRAGPGRPRSRRIAYLYLAPALALYTAFVVLPWLHTMWLSFFEWDGVTVGTWAGLANYREVLTDPALRSSIVHALGFIGFYSLLPIALGLLLAAVIGGRGGRRYPVSRTVLFLPQIIPLVAVGVTWKWMYSTDGIVNQVLRAVGLGSITRAWLGDFTWAYVAVGLVGTWVMLGLCLIVFQAGIQKIDSSLYEAARLDGAGPVQEFFAVTLPGLRAEIGVALTITVISALASFDVVYVTTGGGPGDSTTVPGVLIYRLAFTNGEVGAACALAVVLSALIALIVLAISRITREKT
ncbi:ABC transporter permease [Kitasatospora herbaricolor]|uniref:carbohydrate ABC transporter permease n=1 Tax=Kitasatospora herbaricolor TaxID=68217 RepID=UPI00174EBBA0|nr:sugar ABC transporter permease [Kitasatospora herbaricolor]MDQ0312592.1 raffinose/stachyose/melibiose transport system permease protein [Kitasatospora herbaricolor]GGV29756.1 ABC transporter permease [Kitasatospora herbaricolor]